MSRIKEFKTFKCSKRASKYPSICIPNFLRRVSDSSAFNISVLFRNHLILVFEIKPKNYSTEPFLVFNSSIELTRCISSEYVLFSGVARVIVLVGTSSKRRRHSRGSAPQLLHGIRLFE